MEKWVLPNGWEWATVRKVVKDTSTRNPSQLPDLQFYYIDISSIDNEKGAIKPVAQILGKDAPSRARKVVRKDDVLFATTRPYLKNIALVPEDYDNQICSTGFCVLRANEDLIIPAYLYYISRSNIIVDQLESKMRGASYPAVSDNDVMQVEIPLPSKGIQEKIIQRIEAVFSELTEARRLHEKIVADTNRLMDAVLAEYFPRFGAAVPEGWEWKSISFLAHDTDRQNPTLTAPNEYFNYIDISGVDNALGAVTEPKRLLGQDAPSRARKIVHADDVIFATTRPYLKNIALIPTELDHSICSTGFCVLVPKVDNCVPQYLYYAARSESVIQQLIPKQRGASYPAVLDQDIFNSYIPIPYPGDPARSKTSQEIIAKQISEMEVSVSEAQLGNTKTGALLNQMEQSILAQAFRGEL